MTNLKAKKVMGLFAKLEMIRPIAFKNYLFLLGMLIIYMTSLGIGMYTFLGLNERPYVYGLIAPILILLFTFYYLLFFFCMRKVVSYKN